MDLDGGVRDVDAAAINSDVAATKSDRFAPAQTGVCTDQDQRRVLGRHFGDETFDLDLRQVARRLLPFRGKWHDHRRIQRDAFVLDGRGAALTQGEYGLPGRRRRAAVRQHAGEPDANVAIGDLNGPEDGSH